MFLSLYLTGQLSGGQERRGEGGVKQQRQQRAADQRNPGHCEESQMVRTNLVNYQSAMCGAYFKCAALLHLVSHIMQSY